MRDKQDGFLRAQEALSKLDIPGILPALHEAGISIKRSTLGGSHSVVTYPPLDSLEVTDNGDHIANLIQFGPRVNLYVHIAFCETQCTFCHYAVRNYRGARQSSLSHTRDVDRYLKALECEIALWAERLRSSGTAISSIYIGGGTPLVLESGQLMDLIETLRKDFHILRDAEICLEGSPLTITASDGKEKLCRLAYAGVTRFSFGVQSFDDVVLQSAARGYQRETAIRACEIADSVFDNWNLDLIQGLYRGSSDEVWRNLEVIEKVRPPHLTWYHGRFANRPQGDWYQIESKRDGFEDEQATLFGRMLIWQQMEALGYHQIDGNRFVSKECFIDPFKNVRTSMRNNLLGVGASSYSHVDMRSISRDTRPFEGIFFRNLADIESYTVRAGSGRAALGSHRFMDAGEWLAGSYVVGLRTGRVGRSESTRYYRDLEIRMVALGVLERFTAEDGAMGLRMTPLGRLFEDEVLASFYSPAIQKALR